MPQNTRTRTRPTLKTPAVTVSDEQQRDEFWDLAWKTVKALDAAIAKAPPPPVEEWGVFAPVPDLPLLLECWNEAALAVRRPLLTAGPARIESAS